MRSRSDGVDVCSSVLSSQHRAALDASRVSAFQSPLCRLRAGRDTTHSLWFPLRSAFLVSLSHDAASAKLPLPPSFLPRSCLRRHLPPTLSPLSCSPPLRSSADLGGGARALRPRTPQGKKYLTSRPFLSLTPLSDGQPALVAGCCGVRGEVAPASARHHPGRQLAARPRRGRPPTRCGCAVRVYEDTGRAGDVARLCGSGFCRRCGCTPHWPASCAVGGGCGRGESRLAAGAPQSVLACFCSVPR